MATIPGELSKTEMLVENVLDGVGDTLETLEEPVVAIPVAIASVGLGLYLWNLAEHNSAAGRNTLGAACATGAAVCAVTLCVTGGLSCASEAL